jgi:hypothetical protein
MDFAEFGLRYTGFNDINISIRVLNGVTEYPRQYSPMVHHSGPILSILSSHLAKYVICEHVTQKLLRFRYRFIVQPSCSGGLLANIRRSSSSDVVPYWDVRLAQIVGNF